MIHVTLHTIKADFTIFFVFLLQNKLFVYRGLEYERVDAFTQRLQTEWPSAQILTKNTPPDESIVNGEGQCIFLYKSALWKTST